MPGHAQIRNFERSCYSFFLEQVILQSLQSVDAHIHCSYVISTYRSTHRMFATYQDISTTIYVFQALPNRSRYSRTLRYDYLSSMHFVPSRWADELSFNAEPDPLTGHVSRSMQEDLCHVHVDFWLVASACLIKLCSSLQ